MRTLITLFGSPPLASVFIAHQMELQNRHCNINNKENSTLLSFKLWQIKTPLQDIQFSHNQVKNNLPTKVKWQKRGAVTTDKVLNNVNTKYYQHFSNLS